ncbi:hypothetical protein A0H81_07012 [Grifola frondosa]|uniref:FHA domain-containing protein n=1 Tax=Grifola frondosa TaxID=5627 RepID=A0A1C7M8L9_GRIFR|nr:hypothetical protein A0H81_07012 [Grifola frondosa]
MWVITGPFDLDNTDKTCPPKSKLLKAGKEYVVGRKGEDLDILIRDKGVSKRHATFVVGQCSEENVADPLYKSSLLFHNLSDARSRTIENEEEGRRTVPPEGTIELLHGDYLHITPSVVIKVRWERICCLSSSNRGTSFSIPACASLGISLVYASHPNVTHHLTPTFSLTPLISTSLLSIAHIVRPDWLTDILRLGESADGSPSPIEQTFSLPPLSKYRPTFTPALPVGLRNFQSWEPNETRAGMLRNHRFVFVGAKGREVQEATRELVRIGGGDYECFSVEGGRRAFHQVLAKGQAKGALLVLVADESSVVTEVGKDGWQELADEATSFDLRFVPPTNIYEAVAYVDVSYIDCSSSSDTHGSATLLPDVVVGTMPEEPSIPPDLTVPSAVEEGPRRRLPRRAASRASSRAPSPPEKPSSVTRDEGEIEEAPKPRRTLVRRAGRPRNTIIGIDDFSADLDLSSTSQTPAPEPEPMGPPTSTVGSTSGRPSRLKRRVGTQAQKSQLFTLDEDLMMPDADEPPLKKFRALFDQSDPDRVSQLTMDENTNIDIGSQIPKEEEESQMPGTAGTQSGLMPRTQSQGLKRSRPADDDVDMEDASLPPAKKRAVDHAEVVASSTSQAVEKPASMVTMTHPTKIDMSKPHTHPAKSKKPAGALVSAPDTDEAFLKAVASKKKGKKAEDTFDREFNNLRISKPELEKDQEQKVWAVLEDFGDDGDVRGNFMVVLDMDVLRDHNDANALRRGEGGRVEWEGRPDFKKFKRKASGGERRPTVKLYAEQENDYGMGPQYWESSGKTHDSSQSQLPPQSLLPSQSQSDDMATFSDMRRSSIRAQSHRKGRSRAFAVADSDDEVLPPVPTKGKGKDRALTQVDEPMNTQATTMQTRSRGKSEPLFVESEDEESREDQHPSDKNDDFAGDLYGDGASQEEMILRSAALKTQESTTRQTKKKKGPAKAAIIDDDSDDGITFKGFGTKKRTRRNSPDPKEIRKQNVLDLVTRSDKPLDARKHKFLQARMGRDERPDLFTDVIQSGVRDYWERFQKPYIMGHDTSHMDEQSVLSSIEQLLTLNGWVAALCPTLTRPFGQNKYEDAYEDLARPDRLYYIGMVIHSADHFLVDQLAVIVQLAKRLGTANIFVSMLDYDSSDSTETLTDLCEAVLTLLGVPFRIRRVPGMTEDPAAAYYPLEEAHTRNLALEPLHELYQRRKIKFYRVIWLKGFTCPNDILETIKVSIANEAAMVCGMDWAEHNGFFIFSDRWRTRDINGDQFRQSKSSSISSSPLTSVPPRDPVGAQRYTQHLPFQVFCCESGTHVVDPAQSYYAGIAYRAGTDFHNATGREDRADRDPEAKCLDSTQAWFCRDLWVWKAKEGIRAIEPEVEPEVEAAKSSARRKREEAKDNADPGEPLEPRQGPQDDSDANAGSDYDASDLPSVDPPEMLQDSTPLTIPNALFSVARILVNPRCVTTYAGVSHTQLALDLFGPPDREDSEQEEHGRDDLDEWEGAPETFVCQEQQTTGGRRSAKTQRRLTFSIHRELEETLSS